MKNITRKHLKHFNFKHEPSIDDGNTHVLELGFTYLEAVEEDNVIRVYLAGVFREGYIDTVENLNKVVAKLEEIKVMLK